MSIDKAITKFNNGRLAYLCPNCRVILATGWPTYPNYACKCGTEVIMPQTEKDG